jgi:PIN domain nuclease of toxin-antitoxin system
MRLLIDSQILIWAMVDDARLRSHLREAMQAAEVVHVSAASIWEIAIKRRKGRLSVPDDLVERVDRAGFRALSVTIEHGWLAGSLPRLHDDPFDRVIVAQAIAEGLTIATSDRRIQAYGVPTIAA